LRSGVPGTDGSMPDDDESRYRLPRTATPSRYELEVDTDLTTSSFSGSVDVSISVHEPTAAIVLNAAELRVGPAWITPSGGARLDADALELDAETQRLTVRFGRELSPGEHVLHVAFAGELNDRLLGHYRSTYTDDDGTEHVIGTTHFEPTDARKAFPCWDEPDLKAVFSITLVADESLAILANGPEVSREPAGEGRVRVRFADTMPMSTYLVAYCVGQLEITDPVDVDGVPLRVVHVPGKGDLARFALEVGAFSLRFFTDYYGIPYPDRKVDMIALPDFAAGAMENLGLITYRETYVLIDPERSTQAECEAVVGVIAHELAHMWFGDLVTMRWWNGLWLNEAFATFMENLVVDAFRHDWDAWSSFRRTCSTAFDVDALDSTRPIEYPVHSPDDAHGMFDTLTYTKGAAVLRMLEQYLGPEGFRDGIRRYLRAHAHGNTETHDLWDAMEAETGEPAGRIMDGWILRGGYPIVSVEPADGELRFLQERFRLEGGDDGTRWEVPLLVRRTERDGVERVLVGPDGGSVSLEPGALAVANAGEASFVRVRYANGLLGRVSTNLSSLQPVERYGVVDDTWAAVVAGSEQVGEYLGFLRELSRTEEDLYVWQIILASLGQLERFLEGEPRRGLHGWVRDLLTPVAASLGPEPVEGEPDLRRSLRGAVLSSLALLAGDGEAVSRARVLEERARAADRVDPPLAAAAITVVAATGGVEDYERFDELRERMPTPQQQLRYLYALADFRVPELLDRTLEHTLTDSIRPQNGPLVQARAIANRDLGERAWAFAKAHWDDSVARFNPTSIIYVAEAVRYLTTPELQRDAEAFFARHQVPQAGKMLDQALERQRITTTFRERVTPELESFFLSR
jgi:puromycin-sensitive aminopeptidase